MATMKNYTCTISRTIGCPSILIDLEDVELLCSVRFSLVQIADILGISRSTLYRRLDEEGICRMTSYTEIADTDLDRLIERAKRSHPDDGKRLLIGHLAQERIIVPRACVRASIRVDPINTELRSITVRRRVYYAASPNAIWHMDGHHKLIK